MSRKDPNELLENFHESAGNYYDYSSDYSDGYQEKPFHPQNNQRRSNHPVNAPSFNQIRNPKVGCLRTPHPHPIRNRNRNPNHPRRGHRQHRRVTLSPAEQYRKKIADENRNIVRKHPELVDWNGIKTIGTDYHFKIPKDVNIKCAIRTFDCSAIRAAIECHDAHPSSRICLLNFANPIKPGGGYLNGQEGQEGSLCRQTLLYPTLVRSYMYLENQNRGSRPEASDIMIYSPNVMVIRDDNNEMIQNFPIDIISASAVNNSKCRVPNSEEIMKNRIRKIILTAISEKVDVLILGAFGCGTFKNNATTIARIFHSILVEEDYKKYFYLIIFPIYKDPNLYQIFSSILS